MTRPLPDRRREPRTKTIKEIVSSQVEQGTFVQISPLRMRGRNNGKYRVFIQSKSPIKANEICNALSVKGYKAWEMQLRLKRVVANRAGVRHRAESVDAPNKPNNPIGFPGRYGTFRVMLRVDAPNGPKNPVPFPGGSETPNT